MGILDQVRDAVRRYCILPNDESYDAVTLWLAATHAQPAWETATRLVITAPEKQCGKSRLLDMVDAMSFRPFMSINTSAAALVASIDQAEPPTILLDELDTVFTSGGSNETLRGILNAGHQRNRPYVRMSNGQPVENSTFAMAAMAGIGSAPDTIMDRAVVIFMRRRGPDESVAPYRRKRDELPLRSLGFDLAAWVRDADNLMWLEKHEPETPLEDRPADNWEPLLAIADLAGGTWPERARRAAVRLCADADEARVASHTQKLLSDIRGIFADMAEKDPECNRIGTAELVNLLRTGDTVWSEDVDLDDRKLGRMLTPYGIKAKPMQFGHGQAERIMARGYEAPMFAYTFRRYLKPLA